MMVLQKNISAQQDFSQVKITRKLTHIYINKVDLEGWTSLCGIPLKLVV